MNLFQKGVMFLSADISLYKKQEFTSIQNWNPELQMEQENEWMISSQP